MEVCKYSEWATQIREGKRLLTNPALEIMMKIWISSVLVYIAIYSAKWPKSEPASI